MAIEPGMLQARLCIEPTLAVGKCVKLDLLDRQLAGGREPREIAISQKFSLLRNSFCVIYFP
jgi:hypothetical protein